MIKRKLSLIIALAVMLSSMPFYAFATEETAPVVGGNEGNPTTEETTQEEPPAPAVHPDGWDGDMYYQGGQAVTGPRYIKGTATVKKKVKHYYNKKKKKWQTKKIRRARTKYKTVTKKVTVNNLYLFGTDGKLVVRNAGVFSYNGKEYYSLGGGKIKTGWVAAGKKAMFFYKSGAGIGSMAKNTNVGHLRIPKSGRLGEAYALGVKQLNKSGWSLKAAYKFSYRLRYRDRGYRRSSTEAYAIRGFKKKNGNCYVMASTFYVMAKLLGYDVTRVAGKVAGRNPHSWTVIKQKGKERVYDPNFRNETGRSGWKIWYGKKGTWRYSNYYKVKDAF